MRKFRKSKQTENARAMDLDGTEFSVSVLPLGAFSKGYWARTRIEISNPYLSYSETGENISRAELENWIVCMFRFLAGAYGKEYSLSFEKAGLAVDFYPHTDNGEEVSRADRRKNDCVMVVRLLMRSPDKKRLLGGVYSLLFHRKDIEIFAAELRKQFDAVFADRERRRGKYLFVGVSPQGYKGCCYWYLDGSGQTKTGDYVWVRMGRHNAEQIVYVAGVKYCDDDDAPYSPSRVKRVLRKATDEEISPW